MSFPSRNCKPGWTATARRLAVNDELAKIGYTARLAKGGFYFHSGEAAEWLDRTVNVETISSHTVDQWIDEFKRLKELNEQIMAKPARKSAGAKRRPN